MSKQLPRGWQELKLKDILHISLKKYDPKKDETNYRCIELEHIESNTGILKGYTNSTKQLSVKNMFQNGDILYGKLRPYLKKFYNAKFDGVCSSEIWVLKGKNVINNFLYYFIQSSEFNYIANVSYGTKMPRADWNYMAETTFLVPPLDEQKRIADILSTFDDLIENLKKLIEKKEIYKKGVMQRVLSGEVRFDGFTDEWETVSISELVDKNIIYIEKGKAISKNKIIEGDIPVIAGGKTPAYYHNEYTHDFPCITISASGTAGYVWFHDYKIWASDCNVLYTDNKNYNVKFLYYYLLNIQKIIYGLKTGGVQPHVYAKDIITLTIPNINTEEQNKIAELLTLIDKDIDNLKQLLHLRKLQKKGVMQKLLTGEVRV